ncbi:MAG: hypothetical protein KatS3mg079_067 [Caloramator sp.]|nr:MAG: hypothetical protein KatS3mg079_067 [Caloramator sp.]
MSIYQKSTYLLLIFSGRGPTFDGINKPDIVAPCIDILSLNCDTKYIPTSKHKYSIQTPYKSASGNLYILCNNLWLHCTYFRKV